ncbi:MAG: serine/threonine protein phosphatase [Alphaproteobacteria bacterium]|nr:serine/threonine protein phosphatase [Alphaproteobacteria bacterium]
MAADISSPLTFAVGDIHGCLEKLNRLLAACEAHAGARPARYVFLGDYIDRGPDSRGVIDRLMAIPAARPCTVVCLRGNHEQMAVDAHASVRAVPLWLANNALSTLRNYDGRRISPEHLAWLNALPFSHDDGLRFFVHAGIDPSVPLAAQAPEVMLWTREPFLSECDTVDCGRFIVHGHTPLPGGRPDLRRRRVNLDTAAVMGGPLTAAIFEDTQAPPLGFLTDASGNGRSPN